MHLLKSSQYFSRGVNIDISNKCILQCPACDRQTNRSMVHKAKDITLENYEKLLDTFPKIIMCGQISDPIYHPKFLELLKMSKKLKLLDISTNGSGKKEKWWEEAFNIGIENKNTEWRFALDGLPSESHIYRINQKGEQVWEMMKMGREMGANITWQYIPFLYNENHVDEALQLAKEYGMKFLLKISSRHPEGMKPSKKELRIDRIRVKD